jgi:UDP:flavonoid glycosyltransferase YjiC (YdhE family)
MEVSARVEYMKVGINLRTNHPAPVQIKEAVHQVFSTPDYKKNAQRIAGEMACTDAPKKAVQIIESYFGTERSAQTEVIEHSFQI